MITVRVLDCRGLPRDVNLAVSAGEEIKPLGDKYQIVSDMPRGLVPLFTGTLDECVTAFDRLREMKKPCHLQWPLFYDLRKRNSWVEGLGPDHHLKQGS